MTAVASWEQGKACGAEERLADGQVGEVLSSVTGRTGEDWLGSGYCQDPVCGSAGRRRAIRCRMDFGLGRMRYVSARHMGHGSPGAGVRLRVSVRAGCRGTWVCSRTSRRRRKAGRRWRDDEQP